MKTAAQAAAAYGTNGSSATAQANWATDWAAAVPTMQANAAKQVNYWQAQVSTQQAAENYVDGINDMDVSAATTKVNGVGKASFAAGVKAASTGAYATFAQSWMQAVGTEVQSLNRTNPRGDRAQNRARQAAYDAWIDQQAGKFKQ